MNQEIKNAIVGQSGGPTAAINATLAGVIMGAADASAAGRIGKLFGMKHGIEGLLEEDLLDLSGLFGDTERLELLSDTPAAALGSCRRKLPTSDEDPLYGRIFSILEKANIGYFFYIGGNDSMDTVYRLRRVAEQRGSDIRFIGVPKTIDNDLCGTDHTPGYGSAAKYIAVTVSEIIRDCAVYTLDAVTVVEIMGRDAGWLTAASALPALYGRPSPDLVYLPEVPFSPDAFLADVKRALSEHPNVVVAVSEGIRLADGTYVGASNSGVAKDAFGHTHLSGAGAVLRGLVKEKIGCKVRSIELNLPQRCASHLASATDIEESHRIGRAAVEAALGGASGCMMAFERISEEPYTLSIATKDIDQIANAVRSVPRSHINEQGNHVTDACLRYIAPLIVGERRGTYENGLPNHLVF